MKDNVDIFADLIYENINSAFKSYLFPACLQPDKCQLLVSFSENTSVRVYEYDVRKSEYEKLLGVKFDTKLTFENHITDICSKASRKIYALAMVAPYLDQSKDKQSHEHVFQFSVQLLSAGLDVSQSHRKWKN